MRLVLECAETVFHLSGVGDWEVEPLGELSEEDFGRNDSLRIVGAHVIGQATEGWKSPQASHDGAGESCLGGLVQGVMVQLGKAWISRFAAEGLPHAFFN